MDRVMRGQYGNILVWLQRHLFLAALARCSCASNFCMLDTQYSKRCLIFWFDATARLMRVTSFLPLKLCLQHAAAASIADQPEILLAVERGNRAQVFCHLVVDPFAVFDEDPW